jgi:homocysteine S-methyltransferase
MAPYRNALPQLDGSPFLADGGLETTLVFHDGIDLPCFAAFTLLGDEQGRAALRRYFEPYLRLAADRQVGFILDTATWRASADWGTELGYSPEAVDDLNRASVAFASELRKEFAADRTPIVINGVVGPRGDGYRVDRRMTVEEARVYHGSQIEAFRDADADLVSAITMTYVEETIGIAEAAQQCGMPVVISFTVETNGQLPSGESLHYAIDQVDQAMVGYPAYYMINCAHPLHLSGALAEAGLWRDRVYGIRANASTRSHAELDAATELDAGDPAELAQQYRELCEKLPRLSVFGGCCGTDHRHIQAICDTCVP